MGKRGPKPQFDGITTIRLSKGVREELESAALQAGRTITDEIRTRLSASLAGMLIDDWELAEANERVRRLLERRKASPLQRDGDDGVNR